MVLIYGLLIVAMMFFLAAPDHRRQDGPDEAFRSGQPRRPVGGMRGGAAPDTLTT